MKRHVTAIVGLLSAFGLYPRGLSLIAQGDLPVDRRERVLERIEMMRMWKMTEDLDLTEREGAILFPFLRELEGERRALDEDRRRTMRELRATVRGENPDPDVVDDLLDRLVEIRKGQRRLEDRETEKIRELLGPERVARYLIFRQEFDRQIREVIFQARREGPRRDFPERIEPPPPPGTDALPPR